MAKRSKKPEYKVVQKSQWLALTGWLLLFSVSGGFALSVGTVGGGLESVISVVTATVTGVLTADDITVGDTSDSNPVVNIIKSNAGGGQLIFTDNATQGAQITLGSNEDLLIRTDTNQPLVFGINQSEKMRLDVSGQLNLGSTITNGQSWVNISSHNAMFSIGGGTFTSTTHTAIGDNAPSVSTFAWTWLRVIVSSTNGTSSSIAYIPVFK